MSDLISFEGRRLDAKYVNIQIGEDAIEIRPLEGDVLQSNLTGLLKKITQLEQEKRELELSVYVKNKQIEVALEFENQLKSYIYELEGYSKSLHEILCEHANIDFTLEEWKEAQG